MYLERSGKASPKFVEFCRRHHLKITPQRTAVFEALLTLQKNHPSADMMFQEVREKIPCISYDTVNRILLKFAEIGLVGVVEGQGGPRRFDQDTENHHHFHCIRCARIFDFLSPDCDDIRAPGEIERKFRILSKRVVLTGICDICAEAEKSAAKKPQ
jgi:Fur family peroxide stress response transcriptional regulator